MKKVLALLAALALTAALAGCSESALNNAAGTVPQTPAAETGAVTVTETTGVVEDAVSYTIAMPSADLASADAARVINDYYALQTAKLVSLAKTEVYDAVLAAQTPTVGDVAATVDDLYMTGSLLSVQRSVAVTVGEETQVTRYAETFSGENGGQYTLADLGLTADTLVPLLQSRLAAYGDGTLQPGWEEAVSAGFEPTQFALTEDGLVVFYQAGVLSPGAVFEEIPYDQLPAGFRLPG